MEMEKAIPTQLWMPLSPGVLLYLFEDVCSGLVRAVKDDAKLFPLLHLFKKRPGIFTSYR